MTGHRIERLVAHTATFVTERPDGRARDVRGASATGRRSARRPVDTEDVAVVLFETDAGACGSVVVSQVSPGRKNRLWFEVDGADAAMVLRPGGRRAPVGRDQEANTIG